MNAPMHGVGLALSKCFDRDGDCTIAVLEEGSHANNEPGHVAKRQKREVVEFRVWSKLLANWSDVFKAMFSHDCIEKNRRRIELIDFSPVAVEVFLRFLYSGNLSTTPGISLINMAMMMIMTPTSRFSTPE
eukprot:7048583-Karenia_brevis.AAC.1